MVFLWEKIIVVLQELVHFISIRLHNYVLKVKYRINLKQLRYYHYYTIFEKNKLQESISILIVEDDVLIAQDLKEILEEFGYEKVFRVRNYQKAIEMLNAQNIDLALLDINLNDSQSGIDLATTINQQYQIPFIYITSYSDLGTIANVKQTRPAGFLIKPYSKNLLLASIEIALFNYSNQTNAADKTLETKELELIENDLIINHHLLVKDNHRFIKVPLAEILWFESDRNYVNVKTKERIYIIRCSLKKLLEHLPPNDFVRCYKQFIININHTKRFSADEVIIYGHQIPISRNNQEEVFTKLKMVDYIPNSVVNPK